MMGHREQLKRGDEYDVIGSWRRLYCWTQRAGAVAGVKRRLRRRVRHDARRALRRVDATD